ncbi:hydrogen cyanide synthase subunit HcnA [Pseudoalteromonas sp. A25]|uniref:(2Fe-2S)-binding protein n=1 Tax=Pseudoalteromonas sp. A25 TaxID=116092 RepID=UPI0012605E83|nr:(2Fe-2S)-binding protein [Pseudoalteromonas sp. A25]BBN80858.1 hydrogen cyanide synthase subunit HcnA [Pseudoalteromonas sp. A25]
MKSLKRTKDITPILGASFNITINNQQVRAAAGETLLSVLLATDHKRIMNNDHHRHCGAYCGMGVCHCCQVKVNDQFKQRACQTLVQPNMTVETLSNRFCEEGIK